MNIFSLCTGGKRYDLARYKLVSAYLSWDVSRLILVHAHESGLQNVRKTWLETSGMQNHNLFVEYLAILNIKVLSLYRVADVTLLLLVFVYSPLWFVGKGIPVTGHWGP
jgi:hypothetical protein